MHKIMTKIHVVGMDERSCDTLRLFFQKFCDNCCEISEENVAEVFLINMDSAGFDNELLRLKEIYPNLPIILTSVKSIDPGEHYFLRKPMIARHLVTIIEKVSGFVPPKVSTQKLDKVITQGENIEISSSQTPVLENPVQQLNEKETLAFVGEAEDIDLRRAVNLDRIFFNMEEHFLAYLKQAYQQAKKENCAVKITGLWKPILIFSESNQIYIEMSDQQLKSICSVSLDSSAIAKSEIKLESLSAQKAVLHCEKHKNYQRLDTFMWKVSLWTSRGRLPREIPLDSALYLLGWPNLTRLVLTPEALRITACWVRYPRTVINLTEVLEVPQRYLFAFIAASYVLGLSGLANRESDNLILPLGLESPRKINLFSRTMKKFKEAENNG